MNTLSYFGTKNLSNFHSTKMLGNNNYLTEQKNERAEKFSQPPSLISPGMSKSLPLVTSAVALASLGVAAYALVKTPKGIKNISKELGTISKELSEKKNPTGTIEENVKNLTQTVETLKNDAQRNATEIKNQIEQKLDEAHKKITEETDWKLGEVKGLIRDANQNTDRKFGEVWGKIGEVASQGKSAGKEIFTRNVEVNGMHLDLACPLSGYGEKDKELTDTLRTEAARRILGAVKPVKTPEVLTIRVPSAEFKGFAKTGGLAVVPREVLANMGALINSKQKVELLADTPMYLGQVENTNYFKLVRKGDKYEYISNKDGKESLMAKLTKIDENKIKIYTENGTTDETVEVFLSDELRQAVPYEEALSQLETELQNKVKDSMNAGKNFETDVISFIAPKPASASMNVGGVEAAVDYDKVLAALDDTTSKQIKHSIEIGGNYELPLSELLRQKSGNREEVIKLFDGKYAGDISKALEDGKKAEEMKITFVPPTDAKTKVKFKAVFYKNRKFCMDGPIQEGVGKNIYNNQTTEAGETERKVYFCKYMYENLVNNHESSTKPLKADWIIGNDWQTGPLTAMIRLLTPARKAHGAMEPAAADMLYNTPSITIMHNFKLQGSVGHSQTKLLNIMFGEHAAKIVENAWMPSNADMPGHLMNGLFSGNCFNPQTMAMSYADDIVFVSRGNFEEMAKIKEFGGTNYALASMRGRTWQYGERAKLEEIARASGIDPNEIPEYATAKGITNGCDRVNNILTKSAARKLEKDLDLPEGSFLSVEEANKNPYNAHQHNKRIYLNRVIEDLNTAKKSNGKDNPLKIQDLEHTDLTGVDENTLVYGMAGRIVDQKGIDNWSEGILKAAREGCYDKENPPVYYLQGIGDTRFIGKYMDTKNKIREIDPKLADRMMYAEVFSEAGRYPGYQLMTDFGGMPSWDEPCGLVHKETANKSGAISIVHKRGGLTDGLIPYKGKGENNEGANAIFVDFMDKETHPYDEALQHNGEQLAKAMKQAAEWYKDKEAFAKGIEASFKARYDWLKGKIQEYAEIGKRHGLLVDSVDSNYAL